jgi:formate C-acetyltransferase
MVNNMTINVRQFVYDNITPYEGDASFLQGPTERTKKLWDKCREYLKEERDNNGLRSADPSTISTITSHKPGYIEKDLETIVGLQTDEPLKRAIKPFGGVRVVEKALNERGIELDAKVKEIFKYAKNHNDAVFSAYDPEIRTYRSKHVLT